MITPASMTTLPQPCSPAGLDRQGRCLVELPDKLREMRRAIGTDQVQERLTGTRTEQAAMLDHQMRHARLRKRLVVPEDVIYLRAFDTTRVDQVEASSTDSGWHLDRVAFAIHQRCPGRFEFLLRSDA